MSPRSLEQNAISASSKEHQGPADQSSDRRPVLLRALEHFVAKDSGPAGFYGVVSVVVLDEDDDSPQDWYWYVRSSHRGVDFGFIDFVPDSASAVVIMNREDSEAFLNGEMPSTATKLVGDPEVLEQFVARYLTKNSFLDIRLGLAK